VDEQTRLPVLIDAGRTEVAVPAYSGTIPKDRWPKRSPWTDSAANQIAVASTLSAYDVISLKRYNPGRRLAVGVRKTETLTLSPARAGTTAYQRQFVLPVGHYPAFRTGSATQVTSVANPKLSFRLRSV
jgi:hypothetical protein